MRFITDFEVQLDELTAQIQKECYELGTAMLEQQPDFFKKGTSQDITNVFLFKKLAAIELRLRRLESAKGRADDFLNMHTPLM